MNALKKTVFFLLVLPLARILCGCGNNSQKQAERCLEALSQVQSADRLYAKIEITMQEGEGKIETANNEEYWRNGKDFLYYMVNPSDEEVGGKLWYLYHNGVWYSQYTHEKPNREGEQWGYEWQEIEHYDDRVAFWELITRPAEEFILLSEETTGEKSLLAFRVPLTDKEDAGLEDTAQLEVDAFEYVFTLDRDGALQELEFREIYNEELDGDEIPFILASHAVFSDAEDCKKQIEAETQKISSIVTTQISN